MSVSNCPTPRWSKTPLLRKLVVLSPCALLDADYSEWGRGVKPSRYPPVKWRLEASPIYRLGGVEVPEARADGAAKFRLW